jgi:prophage regulatory protein
MIEERLLKLEEVMKMTGLGRASVFKQVRLGTFPKPVKLGRRGTAWPLSEIQAWIRYRIAVRDGRMT